MCLMRIFLEAGLWGFNFDFLVIQMEPLRSLREVKSRLVRMDKNGDQLPHTISDLFSCFSRFSCCIKNGHATECFTSSNRLTSSGKMWAGTLGRTAEIQILKDVCQPSWPPADCWLGRESCFPRLYCPPALCLMDGEALSDREEKGGCVGQQKMETDTP